MRQITKDSVNAFLQGVAFFKGNMTVSPGKDKTTLYLHGNAIAFWTVGTTEGNPERGIYISNAGWKSNTTKERLNGLIETVFESIPEIVHFKIYQKDFEWYWKDGESFPSNEWIKLTSKIPVLS